MKSEHRHELKTNELAEWIANFPKWVKENATMIIYVSVVIVLAAGAYFWRVYERDVISVRRRLALTNAASQLPQGKSRILQAQTRGVDIAYVLIQAADSLQNVAQNVEDDRMVALALIKKGEALRTELHYRWAVNRKELTEQISRARESYTKALEKSSAYPELTAMAKFGLGLCEEELGNFDLARQIYNEIVENPDFEYTVVFPQAEQRLSTIDTYKQKVVFRPAPKRQAPAVETVQPEIDLQLPEDSIEAQGPNMFDVPDFNMSEQYE